MASNTSLVPNPSRLVLVIMEIQEKICAVLPEEALNKVIRYTGVWLEAARAFGFPVIATEQYPKGLGHTVAELRQELKDPEIIDKMSLSAFGAPAFLQALQSSRADQVVLCGLETHICIYQTTLDLLGTGKKVFIPADAVISRTKFNWKNGLNLLHHAGAVVGNTETFIYQLLKTAENEQFKKFSKLLR